MADKEFLDFIQANAEDKIEILALKSQYNICVARLAVAMMRGRNERRQGLLDELSFLKQQIDKYE